MTTPSLPPDLPAPAQAYIASMPPGRVELFPLTALDDTGIPCWNAIFHDEAATSWVGVAPHGVGYGSTDAEAITGTTGELAEAVHSAAGIWRMPRRRASHAAMARELGPDSVADPLTLCLPAGCDLTPETELDWVPARRWPDGATVWLPIDIAACSYGDLSDGYVPFTSPITNGLGAGPTLDFAIGHGLCELFQRDGNGLGFRAMDQGIALDFSGEDGPDTFPRDPRTRDLLARLRALGIDVLPKFATDEFGLCNVYCVGDQPAPPAQPGGAHQAAFPLMVTAAGEAASPDREHALRKSILEFAAARARKTFSHGPLDRIAAVAPAGYLDAYRARHTLEGEEGRTMAAMREWLGLDAAALRDRLAATVLSRRSTRRFDSLPTWDGPLSGTPLLAELHRRLQAYGLQVLVLDWSPAHPGVHVVKVVVPGLEVETMSYHRIGERGVRKLLDRASPLVGFGSRPAGAQPVRLTDAATARLGGQPWLDVSAVDRIVGGLYPLYREPEAHSAPIAMERS